MSVDCFTSATELVRLLTSGAVSAREVVEAHLAQIDRVNPSVNAVCTLAADEARAAADRADAERHAGLPLPALHGVPVAIKDLVPTRGLRTTFGSRIFAHHVPDVDALHVERLRRAGAIVLGKTNTPEFGAGSQTFNDVFGDTRNPYDLSRTCGGSSGGSAVALACGMVPLADGSDMGGSLRNPASFCNVVGFRPSVGRVPDWPALRIWQYLSVSGPMARTVDDVALMLSVMAGPDARAPLSIEQPGGLFAPPLGPPRPGARLAWSPRLGRYPVEPEVLTVCEAALTAFDELGCTVEHADPDVEGADRIFRVLRAAAFAANLGDELGRSRDLMKDTVVWNIEEGLALSAADVGRAELAHATFYHRMRAFLERFRFLLLPVVQVAPFPIETRWVTEIDGVPMTTYIDWMASCSVISLTGLPAISVPAGFTTSGLPVGLQIVGGHHQDAEVLRLARAFEQVTGYGLRRPPIAT